MRTFDLFLLLLCSSFVAAKIEERSHSSSTAISQQTRKLENVNNYYDFDVTSWSMLAGDCFRVKVVQQNNDDSNDDGNSYFYHGSYRAQFKRYISYYLCDNSSKNGNSCKMFVTDIQTYLDTTVNFVQTYCSKCQASCSRRRNEEENNDNNYEVAVSDCNTCSKQCQPMSSGTSDETNAINYLDCEESYNDGELQYYSAPQCGNVDIGQIFLVIGQFYDEECTIKLNSDESSSKFGFSYNYNVFETVEQMKIDCSVNPSFCSEVLEASVYCDETTGAVANNNNNNNNNQEYSKLCKAAVQAGHTHTYYKKPYYKKVPTKAIVIPLVVLAVLFSFLSYTYYVRHQRDRSQDSTLLEEDNDYKLANGDGINTKNDASDLPIIS